MEAAWLRQIAVRVEDLDRAVAFYRDSLGLRLLTRFDDAGLAFFDGGTTRIMLDRNAPPALLYLGVPAVAAAVDELRSRGVRIESEPHIVFVDVDGTFGRPGEAEELAFLRDSEGNLVGLSGRAAPASV